MPRRPTTTGRFLRVMTAAALARGLFFMGGVGTSLPTDTSAGIGGTVGCASYLDASLCKQYDHGTPEVEPREFGATDSRQSQGDRSHAELRYTQQHSLDGQLVSATIRGRLAASTSGGGQAYAQAGYSISLYEFVGSVSVTSQVSMTTSGGEFTVSSAAFNVDFECGDREVDETIEAYAGGGDGDESQDGPFNETFESDGEHDCAFSFSATAGGSTNRPAPGEGGAANLTFEMRITTSAEPAGCSGVSGTVRDGASSDRHENPMRGIRVQLRRDDQPVGPAVATDEDGKYCIPTGDGVEPRDYTLRATLIDATNDPPIFETVYRDDTEPNYVDVEVSAADFGPQRTKDIAFSSSTAVLLSDMANIHWQSERFVTWVTARLRVAPADLRYGAPDPQLPHKPLFTVATFTQDGTLYEPWNARVEIASGDSLYEERDGAYDENPENGEWHEIAHHLAHAWGIAPITAAACAGRTAHGGWSNGSTCDSVQEGWPMFLATLASLELDAGRGEGYADAKYSVFGNLDDNHNTPWAMWLAGDGSTAYGEDFALAELLWDLADDTSAEDLSVDVGATEDTVTLAPLTDAVSLGGANLVEIIREIRPNTVVELHAGLQASALVPQNLKEASVSLLGDAAPEISALDSVFLAHGFHPIRNVDDAVYRHPGAIPRTDHEDANGVAVSRAHIERVPGSSILLRNPSDQPVTATLERSQPGGWLRTVVVPAGSEVLAYVQLPPYWRGGLPASGLPACPGPARLTTTITIGAPGVQARTIDSCEYLHAVANADGPAAVTFDVATSTTPSPMGIPAGDATIPLLAVALGGVLAVLLLALGYHLRRPRRGV